MPAFIALWLEMSMAGPFGFWTLDFPLA